MALIGKIREKSWLLLIVIGGALLAFILTDYQRTVDENELQYGLGTVNGEMVDMKAFENEVAIAEKNAILQAQQQRKQSVDPVDRDKVWNGFVDQIVMNKEYDALGLTVSENEFDAFLYGEEGFEVMADLKSSFVDSTGQFDANALRNQIDLLRNSEDPAEVERWEKSKEYYIALRKQQKYFELLSQGVYVTDLEAKNEYTSREEIKSISFVFRSFNEIKNEDISVSDEDLKKYFEEHKNDTKYANKTASRSIRFFDVTVNPSESDVATFNEKMANLKSEFEATTEDSLFVMKNSDVKIYSSTHALTFKPKSDPKAKEGMTYPDALDSTFSNASIGQVVGPFDESGNTRLAKVIDFNTKSLTARHILISAQRGDSAAVAKAQAQVDSLLPLINSDNFESFVTRFSQDPGSKDKGGKYEDFLDYEMVKEFSDFATQKPIGQIGYVQTDYGFHIMETLERKEVKYPVLAIVQKTLKASEATLASKDEEVFDLLYNLDDQMSSLTSFTEKTAMFDSLVRTAGYFARTQTIQDNKPKINGFDNDFVENKLFDLAYNKNAALGDLISSPIKVQNKYIIAMVSAIKAKGTPSFDDVQATIKKDYIDSKKAEMLASEMKGSSLKDIAEANKTQIKKAEVTFGSPQITGAGYEPNLVGAIFSNLKDGQRSAPITGKNGVIVVQIEQTTKAPTASNYMAEKTNLLNTEKNKSQNMAKSALLKQADVVDNRKFFNINLRR